MNEQSYDGRTFVDEIKKNLYFNWSLSGFEVDFCGTCLEAELECLPDSRPEDVPAEGIMEKKTVMVEDWPWIQVVLDGEETPYQKLLLDRKSKRVVLFSSDKVEHHRIRVVKLTENFRTAVAVHSLICDGELSKPGTQEQADDRIYRRLHHLWLWKSGHGWKQALFYSG